MRSEESNLLNVICVLQNDAGLCSLPSIYSHWMRTSIGVRVAAWPLRDADSHASCDYSIHGIAALLCSESVVPSLMMKSEAVSEICFTHF